jgi:hypothetical protein
MKRQAGHTSRTFIGFDVDFWKWYAMRTLQNFAAFNKTQ